MLPKALIVLAILVVGFFGLGFLSMKLGIKPPGGFPQPPNFPNHTQQGSTPGNCLDKKDARLGTSPLALDNLEFITPLGRMSDAHVTPTDHQYWSPKNVVFGMDNTRLPAIYDIYSPADGVITQLERHTEIFAENQTNVPKIDDWRIIIYHSCSLYSIYIHIDKLTDEIFKASGAPKIAEKGNKSYPVNIPVKEGQLIGKLAAHPFDFSVHDQNVTLPGLLNARLYENEYWKIHTVDPFDYFKEPVRSQLLNRVVRTAPPKGGKIDYDIEGKLVGNWFKVGYDPKNISGRFWDAELTIAYNNFDPSRIFISMGDWNGRSGQFAIKGNSPDPKDIGIGQTVKYQLVGFRYQDAQSKEWRENNYTPEVKLVEGQTIGTLLLKLSDKNTLQLETFPQKSPSEVSDFTSKAQTYER